MEALKGALCHTGKQLTAPRTCFTFQRANDTGQFVLWRMSMSAHCQMLLLRAANGT